MKHGYFGTKVYYAWGHMIQRCTNTKNWQYPRYGGRGITVCDEWRIFENFLRDMGKPPTKEHSVDRIDNSKGYFKENCRWAMKKEQARNRRTNRLITYNGETKTIVEWSEITGVSQDLIQERLTRKGRHKWPIELALFTLPQIGRNQAFRNPGRN